MKRYALPVIGFVLAGALAGCGQSQTSDNAASATASASASPSESASETPGASASESPEATEKPAEKPAEKSPHEELADAYDHVLDNPGDYKFNHPDPYMPSGSYTYALADITGDGRPELLLQPDVTDYFAPVTVFSKPAGEKLFNTRQVLIAGAASTGGSRYYIDVSGSGNGLYQISGLSTQPMHEVQHFVVRGNKLVPGKPTTERHIDEIEDSEHVLPDWHPSSDRGPLEELRKK
ncbi:FG-GAP repeat domain-containing protein [Pseudoglutamicibacter cumminsii]|uniref:Lipoprotein n=1 Tax=Pseudoglutamicibacter cumminsii TaxID=156979 RepID=A0ABX5L4N6_9MICC|nr:VCBS repeat-containing protein [Pseudoglutamicibacter cumminsii]PWI27388.1 hypothetical protein CAY35_07935 [Pseudoglutamicibacter cumminsii]